MKRKSILEIEKNKRNELERENELKRCPSKITQSLSKEKFKVEKGDKNF